MNLLIDSEVIAYTSHTDSRLDGLTRGRRNTAAATHAINSPVYWVEHEIVFVFGNQNANTFTPPTITQPVIDLGLSTNGKWVYPGPFSSETSQRIGLFVSGEDKDANILAPFVSLVDDGTHVRFTDTPAVAGSPARNYVELNTPALVDAAASALTHDVVVPNNMLCNVYGFDGDGNKSLLAQYDSVSGGTGKTVTPAVALTRLRYEAMHRTITGVNTQDVGDLSLTSAANYRWGMVLKLDADSMLKQITLRLKKDGSANGDVKVCLYTFAGSGPVLGVLPLQTIALASIGLSYADVQVPFTYPLALAAGSYILTVYRNGGTTGNIYWSTAGSNNFYANGSAWAETAGTWAQNVGAFGCALLGDGSICQPEVPTGSALYVQIDNIVPVFAATTTPSVAVSARETVYAYNGVLAHPDTGQSVTIKAVTALNAVYTVDALNKVVTCTDLDYPLATATFSDETEMLRLNVGAQTPTWTEASIAGGGSLGIVASYRKRWP
jgi:hypothetical protein